jgi:hypothetical protein
MPQEFKPRMMHQVVDIFFIPGKAIIYTNDFMPVTQEPLAEMGAEESGPAGY